MSAITLIKYPIKIMLYNKEVLFQLGKVVFLDIDMLHRGCSCNTFKSVSKRGVFSPLIREFKGIDMF